MTEEGKWTRKASERVDRLNEMLFKISKLQREIGEIRAGFAGHCQALKVEITEMERNGEPLPPWARHWRINYLDNPATDPTEATP